MTPIAKFWVNLLLWLLPAVGSAILVRRQPRGARLAWVIVAAAGFLICADKVLDLQMLVYDAGRAAVHAIDSGLGLADLSGGIRIGVLGVGALVVVCAMLWLIRRDEDLNAAKRVALGGVLWIVIYLAIRLLPGLNGWFRPPVTWLAEGIGLVLMWGGVGLGLTQAWPPGDEQ